MARDFLERQVARKIAQRDDQREPAALAPQRVGEIRLLIFLEQRLQCRVDALFKPDVGQRLALRGQAAQEGAVAARTRKRIMSGGTVHLATTAAYRHLRNRKAGWTLYGSNEQVLRLEGGS